MSQRDKFQVALNSLHAASLDERHWHKASRDIDHMCHARGNAIAFGHIGPTKAERIIFADLSFHGDRHYELLLEYMRDYFSRDERMPRLLQLPDSQLLHTPDLYTSAEKRYSAAFNEILVRGNFRNGMSVRMDGPNESCILWNIGDPLKGDNWSSARLTLIRKFLPHLRQHICTRNVLADAGVLGTSLYTMLEYMGCGIVHLDWRGRIQDVNDKALGVLKQRRNLVDNGGFLSAVSRTDDARLQKMLARALPHFRRQVASGSMKMISPDDTREFLVHVTPVSKVVLDSQNWEVSALVFFSEREIQPHIDPDELIQAFGFTETESRVAALLAQGHTALGIARQWNRSERTIRWHIMQIFSKLGITRQAELVRRVLLLSKRPTWG